MGRHDELIARFTEPERSHARKVLDQLGGDSLDFADLSPSDVRGLLWLYLPRAWGISPEEWPALAEALADMLDLAGRPTLAALAREPVLDEIFAAYARSSAEGHRAAKLAFARTGTTPADTELLAWSTTPTEVEARAFSEAVRLLDTEVAAGTYVPGDSERRTKLTTRWLTTPGQAFGGRTPLAAVRHARLVRWAFAGPRQRSDVTGVAVPQLVAHTKAAGWRANPEARGWLGSDEVEVAIAELVSVALLTQDDSLEVHVAERDVLTYVALGAVEPVLAAQGRALPPYRLAEASVLRWMDYGVGRGFLRSDSGRTQCAFTESGEPAALDALAVRAFGSEPAWPWPVTDVSKPGGPV